MEKLKKNILFGLVSVLAFSAYHIYFAKPVFADEALTVVTGVQISPTIQRSGTLDPNSTYSNKITVTNISDKPITFKIGVDPFSVEDLTYAPIYSVRNAYNQVVNWIEIEDYDNELEPGEMAEIDYTVKIPKDAPAGGQYAVIYAETDVNSETDSIKSVAKAGTILIMRVDGETRMTGEISNTSIPAFLLTPPVSASATFENNGNVDADATLTVKIENYFTGDVIYDGANDPIEKTVLPDSVRELNFSWSSIPRLGVLKVTMNSEFMGDAEIKSRIVIVCPIWFIAIIIAIIIVIVFRVFSKKHEARRIRENSRNSTGSSQKFNI